MIELSNLVKVFGNRLAVESLNLTVPAGDKLVLALTLEPGPGATKPTLPIVASGTAA